MDDARDELDRLIDGALASYSSAEPLAGLEGRVLNRVRVARAARRWMFAWGLGLAVAASVVVAPVVVWTEREAVPKPVEVGQVKRAFPTATARLPRLVPKRVSVKRSRGPNPLPKLDQFPTPTPLTAEERALLALVEHNPKEAQMFADLQKRAEEPIEIQEIQIAPLRIDGIE